MPYDAFQNFADSPQSPARDCFSIVPDDAIDLPIATKAIYVGQAGDLVLIPIDGDQPVTFRNLGEGGLLDVRAARILATGTTASDIVGLA